MSFVWVLIGIVYIIYKLQKEERFFTKSMIIPSLIFIAVFIAIQMISNSILGEAQWDNTLGIIAFVVILVGTFYLFLRNVAGEAFSCDNQLSDKARIKRELINIGHYNIPEEYIDRLITHIRISGENLSADKCYDWICEQASLDIKKLSDSELETKIGVPLSSIPQFPGRYDKAAYRQYDQIRNYILFQKGLRLYSFYKKVFYDEDEFSTYAAQISSLISTHKL